MNAIDVTDVTAYVQRLAYENKRLMEENDELKNRRTDAGRFYASTLSVESVAKLHNVHADTVRKYVALGLIARHPDSTDAKILIRASEALLLDFSTLRKGTVRKVLFKNKKS